MEYQGAEYTVVQGIERRVWKWSASVAGVVLIGQEQTRSAAVAATDIESQRRSLTLRKLKLG